MSLLLSFFIFAIYINATWTGGLYGLFENVPRIQFFPGPLFMKKKEKIITVDSPGNLCGITGV